MSKTSIERFIVSTLLLLVSAQIYAQQSIDTNPSQQQALVNSTTSKMRVNVGLTVFPPISYNNDSGTCIGAGVDIIRDIFASSEYQINLYCATPARVYRDLTNGNVDVTINVKSTEGLTQDVYFSDMPYQMLKVMLYSRNLTTKGRIAAIKQFTYHGEKQQFIDQGYEMVLQANSKEAMTVFLRGGSQGLLSYQMPFDFYREVLGGLSIQDGLTETILETELILVPSYFVINKKSRHSEAILQRINDYYQ
jgi:polar amino acid transport system substrate-binding protein